MSAGLAISAACDAGTLGVCTIANPLIIAVSTLVGATLGLAAGTVQEFSGNSPEDAPGQTAGGRATDEHGNVLGPSGKPAVHQKNHPTRKAAKDAARNEGKGAPTSHPTPARGEPHFHPTGPDGARIPNSTHHNYPR